MRMRISMTMVVMMMVISGGKAKEDKGGDSCV